MHKKANYLLLDKFIYECFVNSKNRFGLTQKDVKRLLEKAEIFISFYRVKKEIDILIELDFIYWKNTHKRRGKRYLARHQESIRLKAVKFYNIGENNA